MNILVTGGAGLIGSHLIDNLIQTGHRVTCLDNFLTGQLANIAHLQNHPAFTLLEHDIIKSLPANLGPFDQIYNLACPASPLHYQKNPIRTLKTSTLGLIHILEHAKTTGAKVLQASTSEIYGDPEVHPQPESYWGNVNPVGLRSCYDEGKRVAETFCLDYHRHHAVPVTIVRIFNTYGPRMHPEDGRVVSNFILQALRGHPITIYGEGQQTRSFCYVTDLVHGLISAMNQSTSPGPLNLGNPAEITVQALAELIIAKTNSQSTITHQPLPADDPRQRQPDITQAKTLLQWQPTTSLEEGLEQTIIYFRS
jgi:UDP-glucuronate decarboxylase